MGILQLLPTLMKLVLKKLFFIDLKWSMLAISFWVPPLGLLKHFRQLIFISLIPQHLSFPLKKATNT
jgi:hypothetical protein